MNKTKGKDGALTIFIPRDMGIFSKNLDPKKVYEAGVALTGGAEGETFVGTLDALVQLGLGDVVARVMNVTADMTDRSIESL